MKKLYVLDASGYIYRSYFAIKNMTNARGESTNALFGFIRSVSKLIKDFQPEHLVAVFDGQNNIKKRSAIFADYKAHRKTMPPDLLEQIHSAQRYCNLAGIPILSIPEVEADDAMASVSNWGAQNNAHVYLCTTDKDLAQCVNQNVSLLNTFKDNLILGPKEVQEVYGVPPEQIVDLLALTGDTSDNIPGVSGFGPKTAIELLKQFKSIEDILANLQQIPGKKKETLQQEAHLAKISKELVSVDYNVPFEKSIDFFSLKAPDVPQLREFYGWMSFNVFIKELETDLALKAKQFDAVKSEINIPEPQVLAILVDDEEALTALLSHLILQRRICFDTETSDIHPLNGELIGIGLAYRENEAWYIPLNGKLGSNKVLSALKPFFENPNVAFFGHNIKYDLIVLESHGITIENICFDTILASYLLNSQSRQHSLDHLALEYFGKVKLNPQSLTGKGKNQITLQEVAIEKVCSFCCENVDYIVRLEHLLSKQLNERQLINLLNDIEIPLLKVLAKMERRGIYIDKHYLENMSKEVLAELQKLTSIIYNLSGEEFNINSPKQLSHILYTKLALKPPKKTATGLSTDADTLESLKVHHPLPTKLLEYRSLEKLRSTYLEALPLEVNSKTHRIHCTFNQSGTATGRLASQDPNLQNIPVRTELGRQIRGAFCPQQPDWSFLSADYSQIELRLLAHLSEDPHLLEAFQNNLDVHAHTASLIFNIPIKEVTKEQRHQAKTVNFGVIYGQQAYGLSQELGIEMKVAAAFIEMYFKLYKRVKDYLEESKDRARREGKAVTMTGRERAIPEMHNKNPQLRALAERLAINTPLQGTAADLIKLAMIRTDTIWSEKKLRGGMILQIHDELLFEAPDDELSITETLAKEAMENVWKLKVPLIVDIAIGKNWQLC